MPERLPRGVRKHIREKKAETRRKDQVVLTDVQRAEQRAVDRLIEIRGLLGSGNLQASVKAELQVEEIWIVFALKQINADEKRERFGELFAQFSREVTAYLDEAVNHGVDLTRLQAIRNRVVDPVSGRLH